jgi:hypothetical protein
VKIHLDVLLSTIGPMRWQQGIQAESPTPSEDERGLEQDGEESEEWTDMRKKEIELLKRKDDVA